MDSEDLFESEHFDEDDEPELDTNDAFVDDDDDEEHAEEDNEVDADEETPATRPTETETPTSKANTETANKENATKKILQLPMARVRNLMKLDPDLQLASHEATFVVARATELFIESFAREAFTYTTQAKKKTIQKRDIDLAIAGVDSLLFLDGAMNS